MNQPWTMVSQNKRAPQKIGLIFPKPLLTVLGEAAALFYWLQCGVDNAFIAIVVEPKVIGLARWLRVPDGGHPRQPLQLDAFTEAVWTPLPGEVCRSRNHRDNSSGA